jgi:hypothetical protein
MPNQYRKRPVVITATRWYRNGDHPLDDTLRPFEDTGKVPTQPREGAIVRYFRHPGVNGHDLCRHCQARMHDHGWIDTLEGGHNVCPGDWIITGVKGEHYPCKPDIFAATYEPAIATDPAVGVALDTWRSGQTGRLRQ